MKYELNIDWYDVKDISDETLKILLPKEEALCRRRECLVKYKNGKVKAFYIEDTADTLKIIEDFTGFQLHIFKGASINDIEYLEDAESITQYLKTHKFIVYYEPMIFGHWTIWYVFEDFDMIAEVPDNTILKDVLERFL